MHPGDHLVLPEKMEVGKAYQLQYEIPNDELAAVGEASVSYSVEEGSDLVDMPDKSGNFTVEAEGTVAFQVNVSLPTELSSRLMTRVRPFRQTRQRQIPTLTLRPFSLQMTIISSPSFRSPSRRIRKHTGMTE